MKIKKLVENLFVKMNWYNAYKQLKIPNIWKLPLIMDFGMNNGLDTRFYLKKGFRVVAVEANPVLVDKAFRDRDLIEHISSGQLIIEPVGLGLTEGEFPFYVNLDNDHWSSFEKAWGTRDGTRHEEIRVSCVRPQSLFKKYGIPYYLKIDVEGFDIEVVRALHDFKGRPRFISVEEHDAYYFSELWSVGCRAFKLVDQSRLHEIRSPKPPLEGGYVEASFDGTSSGPFGEETPGDWLGFDLAMETYLTRIRSPSRGYLAGGSWFDIHGRID